VLGAAGGAGDPQCTGAGSGGASSLRIGTSGGAGDIVIALPCFFWATNSTNTVYKYKDLSGTSCNLVLVKNGVLTKAVCKGTQVAIDLNGSMSPVSVVTTLNMDRYCTEFGGALVKDGSDDKAFLRKDAPAPSACPSTTTTTSTSSTTSSTYPHVPACCDLGGSCAVVGDANDCGGTAVFGGAVCDGTGACVSAPGTPGACCDQLVTPGIGECTYTDSTTCSSNGGTFHAASVCQVYGRCCDAAVGGFCWYLGAPGENCTTVCANVGATYDSATASYAGTGGSDANCQAVLNALVSPDPTFFGSDTCGVGGIGCMLSNPVGFRCTDTPTNAGDSSATFQRACACQ
jgi:hypothetical protein